MENKRDEIREFNANKRKEMNKKVQSKYQRSKKIFEKQVGSYTLVSTIFEIDVAYLIDRNNNKMIDEDYIRLEFEKKLEELKNSSHL